MNSRDELELLRCELDIRLVDGLPTSVTGNLGGILRDFQTELMDDLGEGGHGFCRDPLRSRGEEDSPCWGVGDGCSVTELSHMRYKLEYQQSPLRSHQN